MNNITTKKYDKDHDIVKYQNEYHYVKRFSVEHDYEELYSVGSRKVQSRIKHSYYDIELVPLENQRTTIELQRPSQIEFIPKIEQEVVKNYYGVK